MILNSINLAKNPALLLILISIGAGIIGTGLGGIIGMFFGKSSNKVISCVLNVAAGVMIAIVCFDLIPESEALLGKKLYISILGLIAGFLIIFALSKIFDKINASKQDNYTEGNDKYFNRRRLAKTGLIMVIAISLHNFPEGMAIGSIGSIDGSLKRAILIAILLALHNIPEGMAISVPLITGGMKPRKAIFLVAAAGAVTVLGTAVGYLLGGINPIITAVSLASAGGAMLYVTFAEIIPESIYIYSEKITAVFLLAGLVLGIVAINLGGL